MADERNPVAGLVEKNIPAQWDEEVLKAELEIEMPDSQEVLVAPMEEEIPEDIEIIEDSEGAVIIDFNPNDKMGEMDDFYGNLAEQISDSELSDKSYNWYI